MSAPKISEASPTYKVPVECSKYVEEIEKYGWDTVIAIKIMYAESGCDPMADNLRDNHEVCFGSYGLMQISCDKGILYDSAKNIKVAYKDKYMQGGWKHWSVCKNGTVDCGLKILLSKR